MCACICVVECMDLEAMGRCYSLSVSILLSYSIETGSLLEPEVRLADNKLQRSPYPTPSSRGIDTWKPCLNFL